MRNLLGRHRGCLIIVEVWVVVARDATLTVIGSISVAAGAAAIDWWAVLVEVSILTISVAGIVTAVEVTVTANKRLSAASTTAVVAIGIATVVTAFSWAIAATGTTSVVVPLEVSIADAIFSAAIHHLTIDRFALAILTSLLG